MPQNPHHITRDHYAGFGMIVNVVAELDVFLDAMIMAMIKADQPMASGLLTFLGSKDKRDFIIAMSKASNLPPFAISGLEGLMERIRNAADFRNTVAHCGWRKGRKPGKIKPMKLSARQVLRFLGVEHNEKEWSASELIAEAEKYQDIGRDLMAFMKQYGLYPDIAKMRASKSSSMSRSSGG